MDIDGRPWAISLVREQCVAWVFERTLPLGSEGGDASPRFVGHPGGTGVKAPAG